jgi:hypothetical protein
VALGNSHDDEERCLLAGYDNGDVKMFDLRTNTVGFSTSGLPLRRGGADGAAVWQPVRLARAHPCTQGTAACRTRQFTSAVFHQQPTPS